MKSALPVASRNSVSLLLQPNTLGVTTPGVRSFFWSHVVDIYQQIFTAVKKDPTIFVLFTFIALVDLGVLTFLFLAPMAPVSNLLAPIIRTFWDDIYLHYPQNFLLLPKLFKHAHFLVMATFGIWVNALVVKKIENQLTERKKRSLLSLSGSVLKKYIPLLFSWLAVYFLFTNSLKLINWFMPKVLVLHLGVLFAMTLAAQSLAAFLMPVILCGGKNFFQSWKEAFRQGVLNFKTMSVLTLIPILAVVLLAFLSAFTPVYVRIYPELTLWILVLVSIAMTLVDFFVTSTATVLFLEQRGQK